MAGFSGGPVRALSAVLVALVLAAAPGLGAQEAGAGPYLDDAARRLHQAAVAHRERVDRGLVRYTALVKQRAAASLRMPLRDRMLLHAEGASRVFWERDGGTLIQVLASRVETIVGQVVDSAGRGFVLDEVFDPAADPLTFGLGGGGGEYEDDTFIVHPLGPDATTGYRFASGDTLTLSLPDGRRLRSVELEMRPREAAARLLVGTLWIEPESGALVRAVYRMARPARAGRDTAVFDDDPDIDDVPGLLRPLEFDMTMVAVEYALWDGEYWLPRTLRAEGLLRAGIIEAPATFEVSYTMESVVTETSLAAAAADSAPAIPAAERHFATRSEAMEWLAQRTEGVAYRMDEDVELSGGRSTRYLLPEDPAVLAASPHLPPPVWDDAPAFASAGELEALAGTLADLPTPSPVGVPTTFYWGPERADLLRFNRVEGLSVGTRASALLPTPAGPVSVDLTARLGHADLEPRGSLALSHETLRRRVVLEAYHELRDLGVDARALGPGNSAMALLFGRDDGDYMQATGAQFVLTPPSAERMWGKLRVYAEHQHGVARNAEHSLASLWESEPVFREVRPVAPLNQVGASLLLSPWWGSDPSLPRGGVELWAQAESGEARFARARATLRGVLPLGDEVLVGAELAAGTTWGDAPPQRAWLIGGASTLRGYAPATLAGPSLARGRLELSRAFSAARLALFGDAAWAGESDGFAMDDALLSIGVGISLLDGVIRLDLARGLRDPRGTRVDLYLGGIL